MTGPYDPHPYQYQYRPAEPRERWSPAVVALMVFVVLGLLAVAGAVVFFWAVLAFGGPIG